ncbi:hypothetical protein A9G45_01905 [Gilliamella sp. HK2]|uniref:hypothetical protein n=1 Tax=unclassified Gilliamella TaxID=2685620 RepID=UPI00080DA48C|nr:hypothetical protein [Gilliamella apicola]OCG25681.1 hypothetical protein A9G46_06135 [Gilliamella apicola]OCG30921.1 hypothetical protein A9G45_01905 [Gilliamella apicola]
MTVINYWQKISKRLIIKTALSHLLLGVIATGFGFHQENALPAQQLISQVDIITITAIVQEHQSQLKIKPQTFVSSQKQYFDKQILLQNNDALCLNTTIRLSPNNGIRAGPHVAI